MFSDPTVQFKVTCVGADVDKIEQIFISGEDQVFVECPNLNLTEALVDLISCYYVFDMSYPTCMVGILHFLQEVALECPDHGYKGTKYAAFMTEVRNRMA